MEHSRVAGLRCGDKCHFVGRAASTLLRRALSTQIRIINLHALIEHTALFALVHRLENFVLHEPRGWVGITYLPLVFERLNGVLALLHQIDPKEPLVQWQFRVLTSESMIEEH